MNGPVLDRVIEKKLIDTVKSLEHEIDCVNKRPAPQDPRDYEKESKLREAVDKLKRRLGDGDENIRGIKRELEDKDDMIDKLRRRLRALV